MAKFHSNVRIFSKPNIYIFVFFFISTVSSGINAIGSLLMEDFIIPAKPKLSQAFQVTISKLIGKVLICY